MERLTNLPAVAVLLFAVGCSKPDIPGNGWVADVAVTNRDGTPLASLDVPAGEAVDAIVSFLPLEPNMAELDDRKVYEPEKWRLRGVILDESGDDLAPEAFGASFPAMFGGVSHELHGFQMLGVEAIQGADGSQTAVWHSPPRPEETKEGHRYFWGHTLVPSQPGSYRYAVQLYPTADPFISGETNPEFGPPVTIFETSLVVTPGDPRDAGIQSVLHFLESSREREFLLKEQYSVQASD